MTNLQIDEKKARKMFATAPPEFKEILTDSFPKDFFSQNIIDRVKTWEDILEISGVHPDTFKLRPGETDDELAYRQIKLIAEVYNEGAVLDPGNTNQYKYYPWHEIVKDSSYPSGFGLSYDVYGYWSTHSCVGVRLCFAKRDHAIDTGKKFIDIYTRLKIR